MKGICKLFPMLLFAGICCLACSKSNNDSGCSQEELDNRYNILVAAQTVSLDAQVAYAQSQTQDDCIAYKDAYMNYLHAFEAWIGCLDKATQEQWKQPYADALKKAEDIPC